jgi:hypothetical protein
MNLKTHPFVCAECEERLESPVHTAMRLDYGQEEEAEEAPPAPEPSVEAGVERSARPCNVGSLQDAEVALEHCCRLLAHHFLLKGVPGGFWDDTEVRVSAKALALSCLAAIFALHPLAIRLHLDKPLPGQLCFII